MPVSCIALYADAHEKTFVDVHLHCSIWVAKSIFTEAEKKGVSGASSLRKLDKFVASTNYEHSVMLYNWRSVVAQSPSPSCCNLHGHFVIRA